MGVSDSISGTFADLGIKVNLFGGQVGGFISNLIIFIVFFGIFAVIVYFVYQKKLYNQKIQILEEVNGQTVPTQIYSAKELIIPNTSIKVFQIRENNMYLPRPTIQTGIRNWLFFIRDDHEWVNVGITSLNKQLTELGLKYNHVDMRYANASLKELIKTNYGDKNFWKEYGTLIIGALFFVLIGITFYLVAEKFAEVSTSLVEATKINAEVMREITNKLETSGLTKLN